MSAPDRDEVPAVLHWLDWGVIVFCTVASAWRATGPDGSVYDWIGLAIWLFVAGFRLAGWYVTFENWRPKLARDRWIRGE